MSRTGRFMTQFQPSPSCDIQLGDSFQRTPVQESFKADYLSRRKEYVSELFLSLKKLGKAGPFWTPE